MGSGVEPSEERLIPAHAGKTRASLAMWPGPTAHPRSRGENVIGQLLSAVGEGSSPLTRGKPDASWPPCHRRRLIPAHAGKTSAVHSLFSASQAHPRSRGENHPIRRGGPRHRGSSPLTRGKPGLLPGRDRRRRLIPAHAGKTRSGQDRSCRPEAHPRSRGENRDHKRQYCAHHGSSPLTRGKPCWSVNVMVGTGLIPAHAGKTGARAGQRSWKTAHPRSRGENLDIQVALLVNRGSRGENGLELLPDDTYRGSSPLTRGKLKAGAGLLWQGRLIPAHAGKTNTSKPTKTKKPAHPRSRGENADKRNHRLRLSGSSPLTRGKLVRSAGTSRADRLIPAHAGKTTSRGGPRGGGAAHPRSRGENDGNNGTHGSWSGSSPLTRGKLSSTRLNAQCPRLIPAHAGKTRGVQAKALTTWAHPRSRGENPGP